MKKLTRLLIPTLAAIAITVAPAAMGASPKQAASDPTEMTIDENVATPAVPNKASAAIIRHMNRMAAVFEKHGLEVRRMRKGEVIVVVVPDDKLFMPNETDLSPSAHTVLSAFNSIVKLPALYKVLIVSHTDNTGSETYADQLTEDRANAVDEYFERAFPNAKLNIVPYGMGLEAPRSANTSIGGRQANRRTEIYIIPEQQTVDMARANKL